MSDKLNEKIAKVIDYFKDFTNFIELEDFRSFLLFTLNSHVPSPILAQLGMGGGKGIINLPYNPLFNIHYQKIPLIAAGALIIYVKNDLITDEFMLEKDDDIFKKYLNPNEIDLAFRGKERFLFPKISDCSSFDEDSKVTVKIDDLYHSLESFLAMTEPNILFVIDGKDSDLIFAFNMMPELPGKTDQNILKIDVYLDNEHKTKDMVYLRREEDYKISFMKDIKEIGHADLYKSAFSLIVHIKSFKKP